MKPLRILHLAGSLSFKFVMACMIAIVIPVSSSIAVPVLFGVSAISIFNTGPMPSGMFASVIDISTFTFSPDELRSLREMIAEKVFGKPGVGEYTTIYKDIVHKQKIGLLGRFGLVGKTGRLGCDPNPTGEAITGSSEKQWDPQPVSMRIEECYDDVISSLAIFLQNKGVNRADMTDTEYFEFIEMRLEDALWEMIIRLEWFSDADAANVTASPAGNITTGVDVDYFNAFDGYFKQLFDICTTDTARRVTISKNAQTTYANQAFNSTDTTNKVATNIYRDLTTRADFRLRDAKDKIILSTMSLVDQYAEELRSVGVDASYNRIEKGYSELKFDGVRIIGLSVWDRYIRTYEDTGTYWNKPHRALLMTKSNFATGFEDANVLQTLKVFFADYQRKNVYEMEGMMDVKILEDYMIQFAF